MVRALGHYYVIVQVTNPVHLGAVWLSKRLIALRLERDHSEVMRFITRQSLKCVRSGLRASQLFLDKLTRPLERDLGVIDRFKFELGQGKTNIDFCYVLTQEKSRYTPQGF